MYPLKINYFRHVSFSQIQHEIEKCEVKSWLTFARTGSSLELPDDASPKPDGAQAGGLVPFLWESSRPSE